VTTDPTGTRAETMTLREELSRRLYDRMQDRLMLHLGEKDKLAYDDEMPEMKVWLGEMSTAVAFDLLDAINDRAGGGAELLVKDTTGPYGWTQRRFNEWIAAICAELTGGTEDA
jgi:hypothetical protein